MKAIRMATSHDTEQILAIYGPYILHTTISFEAKIPTKKAFEKRIKKYLAEAPWLVYEINEKIVGYAYASPHRGRAAYQWNREVSVYILEDFHRRGIAKVLYKTLFKLLQVQGYTNALAVIVQPNPASSLFHQNLGFQLVGTYRNIGFKHGQWHDVNWYELFLQTPNFAPKKLLTTAELMQLEAYHAIIKMNEK